MLKINKKKLFNNKSILITGGTGSFGNAFVEFLLKNFKPKRVIIYSSLFLIKSAKSPIEICFPEAKLNISP